MTAIFYGVSPAVISLIIHSCWRLGKLGMEDWFQWAVAGLSFVIAHLGSATARQTGAELAVIALQDHG